MPESMTKTTPSMVTLVSATLVEKMICAVQGQSG